MNLERMLQVSLAATVMLGALLLGIGQGNLLIPLLAAVGAGCSLWLTDFTSTVRLKPHVVTMAAASTLIVFGADLYRMGAENQLVAIANLLVYLQVVLMFQRKALRIYWQLLTLSLLQVVVAAALSLSAWFGPLLLLYLFMGLLSLSLVFAYRQMLRFQPVGAPEGERAADDLPVRAAAHTVLAEGFRPVSRENLNSRRVSFDLLRQTSLSGAATLMLASAFFLVIPRFGKQALITNTLAAQTTIGFKEEVELGNLGIALQDRSSVMRVWFTDPATGLPYEIAEEPLFRGAIVDTYDIKKSKNDKNSKWSQYQPSDKEEKGSGRRNSISLEVEELEEVPPSKPYVVEHIILEEQRENTVFSIWDSYRVDRRSPVEFDPNREQLIRKTRKGRLEFSLATTGLDAGRQMAITFPRSSLDDKQRERLLALPKEDQGRDPLRGLKQVAANWVSEFPKEQRSGRELAIAMADNFARKGFQYSLDGEERDSKLDPIEDFVTLHPRGHCEYFASALALMLRSQGIPARVVIGFKGGEFNSLGNYYQVRMLHAHTWVEAYLTHEQLPAALRNRHRTTGGWLRLDPTPGSDESPESRSLTLAERARDWMDYGDYLWMNYVVGLDRRRQEDSIYKPLSITGEFMRSLFTRRMWTETVPDFVRSLFQAQTWRNLASHIAFWPLLAVAVTLVVMGWLGWRFRQALGRWLRRCWAWCGRRRPGATSQRTRERMVVAFYEQLETLLARHGVRRPASQTQHEFAMSVGGQLSETPRLAQAAWLPRKVVDAFYRVRFGGQALDKTEIEAVERSLRELAAALAG